MLALPYFCYLPFEFIGEVDSHSARREHRDSPVTSGNLVPDSSLGVSRRQPPVSLGKPCKGAAEKVLYLV
jgi:hypothetical protein